MAVDCLARAMALSQSGGGSGAVGPQGPQGEPGYSPVRGVDYWTEEDKEEIVGDVKEVCILKNQGAENVGKILVVGTDGNLVLTDMPEGSSGDVTGVLDESNNILLTGNLADGNYTLKYENADGTYTEIGTLTVGEIEKPRTNFAETLTVGRLSNSAAGNVATDAASSRVTDFISVTAGDIVSVQGLSTTISPYLVVMPFDSSKTKLSDIAKVTDGGSDYHTVQETTSTGATITITSSSVAYIRLSGVLSGTEEDVVVNIQRNGEWL